MSDDASRSTITYLVQRGRLEEIAGDTHEAARQWLKQASDDLAAVALLIGGKAYRPAYATAYDITRKAAEAVVTSFGYRVTSVQGHHEAVFAAAKALDDSGGSAFDAVRGEIARATRGKAEYVDIERIDEITEAEAKQIYAWASEAVNAASLIID